MKDWAYMDLWFAGLLFGLLIVLMYVVKRFGNERRPSHYSSYITLLFAFLAILFFGLRAFDFGTDTPGYVAVFEDVKSRMENNMSMPSSSKDFGFQLLVIGCAWFLSPRGFLLTLSALFVIPLLIVYRKLFSPRELMPFFLLLCSFFFMSYGSNIMRSGIAFSFFLLSIVSKARWQIVTFAIVSISFHLSLALPVAGWYFLLRSGKWKINYSLIIWLVCLGISFFNLDFLRRFLGMFNLGVFTDRTVMYLTSNSNYMIGFRYDFIAFGAFAMAVGLYLRKKMYDDTFYSRLLNLYILLNAVFLLCMGIPYSDRVGLLSWSLIPIVCSYPVVRSGNSRNYIFLLGIIVGMLTLTYFIN